MIVNLTLAMPICFCCKSVVTLVIQPSPLDRNMRAQVLKGLEDLYSNRKVEELNIYLTLYSISF